MDYDRTVMFRAENDPRWGDEILLRWAARDADGAMTVATGVTMQRLEPGASVAYLTPPLRLTPSEAAALMEELWRIGIRPSNSHGSTGQLAATERHLDDMRKIAFNRLEIK